MGERSALAWPWVVCLAAPSFVLSVAALPWPPPFDTDPAVPTFLAAAVVFGVVYLRRSTSVWKALAAVAAALAVGAVLYEGWFRLVLAFATHRNGMQLVWVSFLVGYALVATTSVYVLRATSTRRDRLILTALVVVCTLSVWVASALDSFARAGGGIGAIWSLYYVMAISRAGTQAVYALGAFVVVLAGNWFAQTIDSLTSCSSHIGC